MWKEIKPRKQRASQSKEKNEYRYLASTSYSGGRIPKENVVKSADFILIHGNNVHDPARIDDMVQETKAVKAYASWGYFDYRMKGERYENGFQLVPLNWEISSPRKKAFFNKLEEITGGSEF